MKIKISFKDLQKSSTLLPQKVSESNFEGLISLENIRSNVAKETRNLSKGGFTNIEFNPLQHDRKVAEGFILGSYDYKRIAKIGDFSKQLVDESVKTREYEIGEIYATAQNYAREFMDTPANLMTPTIFAERAVEMFKGAGSVKVVVRERAWAESKNMGAFLSVGRGSDEPTKFLEIHYSGDREGSKPLVLVGKGVTFDSGGISIKPSADMAMMKGDMGGAACVLSSLWAINKLQLGINAVCLIPLTENMPSGKATKPGDVVRAGNGLTIEVDNTDAEGRLILADALHYATSFNPRAIVELSTLTGAMVVALGECYVGLFTKSDILAEKLLDAGKAVDDELWRMPMSDSYKSQLESQVADFKNVGGRAGGACTAAIFLQQFAGNYPYAHLDIAGVMSTKKTDLLSPGMTGRPTRSIIEFAAKLAESNDSSF